MAVKQEQVVAAGPRRAEVPAPAVAVRLDPGSQDTWLLVQRIVAALALLVMSPMLLAIAVAVRRDSPGPALFRQERVGCGERPFKLLKFRTMCVDADEAIHRSYVTRLLTEGEAPDGGEAGVYKLTADPRVTRIGHWLRRSSLDELPQLLNVVRGEMALVGPRPSLAYEVELFEERHRQRAAVPPGVTGLWQVSGRSTQDMRSMLDLDLEYVERRSVMFDIGILLRTLSTLWRWGAAR